LPTSAALALAKGWLRPVRAAQPGICGRLRPGCRGGGAVVDAAPEFGHRALVCIPSAKPGAGIYFRRSGRAPRAAGEGEDGAPQRLGGELRRSPDNHSLGPSPRDSGHQRRVGGFNVDHSPRSTVTGGRRSPH
jgi:hypothetical protein